MPHRSRLFPDYRVQQLPDLPHILQRIAASCQRRQLEWALVSARDEDAGPHSFIVVDREPDESAERWYCYATVYYRGTMAKNLELFWGQSGSGVYQQVPMHDEERIVLAWQRCLREIGL